VDYIIALLVATVAYAMTLFITYFIILHVARKTRGVGLDVLKFDRRISIVIAAMTLFFFFLGLLLINLVQLR